MAINRQIAASQQKGQHPERQGDKEDGPPAEALKPLGLVREIAAMVGGFSTALALVRTSDLIVAVPERHTGNLRAGLHSFPLPVPVPEITVSMLWHPRLDADPAHRWLRDSLRAVCTDQGRDPGMA